MKRSAEIRRKEGNREGGEERRGEGICVKWTTFVKRTKTERREQRGQWR